MKKIVITSIVLITLVIGVFSYLCYTPEIKNETVELKSNVGELTSITGNFSHWMYLSTVKAELQIVERNKELFFTPLKNGNYQIFCYGNSNATIYSIVVGSNPGPQPNPNPGPQPNSEYAVAWQKEFDANKVQHLSNLIKVYKDGLMALPSCNSFGDLSKKMNESATKNNTFNTLPHIQAITYKALKESFPSSPSIIINRTLAEKTLNTLVTNLEKLK